jgi:hypothetical protein
LTLQSGKVTNDQGDNAIEKEISRIEGRVEVRWEQNPDSRDHQVHTHTNNPLRLKILKNIERRVKTHITLKIFYDFTKGRNFLQIGLEEILPTQYKFAMCRLTCEKHMSF